MIVLWCISLLSCLTGCVVFVELYPLDLPSQLAKVGFKAEFLSRCRASARQILGASKTLADGYEKV